MNNQTPWEGEHEKKSVISNRKNPGTVPTVLYCDGRELELFIQPQYLLLIFLYYIMKHITNELSIAAYESDYKNPTYYLFLPGCMVFGVLPHPNYAHKANMK